MVVGWEVDGTNLILMLLKKMKFVNVGDDFSIDWTQVLGLK